MPHGLLPGDVAETLLDNLPMGILYCDAGSVIRFVNTAYARLLGCEPADIVGKHITEVIPTSRAHEVMARGIPEMGDLCSLSSEGGAHRLVVNRIPLHDVQGRACGMISQAMFSDPSELKALHSKIARLEDELRHYKKSFHAAFTPQYSLQSIQGDSAAMRAIRGNLRSYARMDAPVLILGATGTGKELFAHALHAESSRSGGPIVSINCAAIPAELFESELFGYKGGAFSGAHHDGKMGQLELAHNGTLFLDEIGDMPLHAQAKLLRVLETRSITRVGSVTAREVDFRLVAATNRDIKTMVGNGTFREDLYYRINTFVLDIPPLCERRGDILPLARHFLLRMGFGHVPISDEAAAALHRFSWPGNVRQLHNTIVHAATMHQGGNIELGDLPAEVRNGPGPAVRGNVVAAQGGLSGMIADQEAVLVEEALRKHRGNISRAAAALGIARGTLYGKIQKYGIVMGRRQEG